MLLPERYPLSSMILRRAPLRDRRDLSRSRVASGGPARRAVVGAALAAVSAIGGCVALSSPFGGAAGLADGPGDRALAALSAPEPVRDLPKARRGNMAEYTVRGRRYRTLDSAAGFRERGIASWYGAKFHGRETSSGEPFDMYAMTAAHRHLPLPTFVRVTDLASGRAVTVKVNDRGPFVDDRVIDLSYAAAYTLGMLESGTADVRIEALSTHLPSAPPAALAAPARARPSEPSGGSGARTAATDDSGVGSASFIQIGAFRDDTRAHALARRVAPYLSGAPLVRADSGRALWRVRIGPLADASARDAALAALARAGIDDYTLVTATSR